MITLSKAQERLLPSILADAFHDDMLYITAFPNVHTRRNVMESFFQLYLKAILPFSVAYADSSDLNCIMIVFDNRKWRAGAYYRAMIKLNLKLVTLIPKLRSVEDIVHSMRCYGMFTSAWVNDFKMGQYFHLDLLCTRNESRGQGLGSALCKALIQQADISHMDMTLETHEQENVVFYERFGFDLVKTISHEGYGISQYCMLRRAGKEERHDN